MNYKFLFLLANIKKKKNKKEKRNKKQEITNNQFHFPSETRFHLTF